MEGTILVGVAHWVVRPGLPGVYQVRLLGARAHGGRALWRLEVNIQSRGAKLHQPPSEEFRRHTENLREVKGAVTQIERTHKCAIRDGNTALESAIRRVHLLLLGVFAEASLRAILTDPAGFSLVEREEVWKKKQQEERWIKAVAISESRALQAQPPLPPSESQRIANICSLIKDELKPLITDRNKLAHGQWVHQLKSRDDEKFLQDSTSYDYNYCALRARYRLIQHLTELVKLLCISPPTLHRDFDAVMKSIELHRSQADGHEYARLVTDLRRSKERALGLGALATQRGCDDKVSGS